MIHGSNWPGPDLPGPNLPRHQRVWGPICCQISEGPKFLGLDLQGPNLPRTPIFGDRGDKTSKKYLARQHSFLWYIIYLKEVTDSFLENWSRMAWSQFIAHAIIQGSCQHELVQVHKLIALTY